MAFRLPNFNLTVNLWRVPNVYAAAPDLVVLGNLSPGKRGFVTVEAAGLAYTPLISMELLLPALTDVRAQTFATASDMVEIPAGSGRCYIVGWVDDVAKGFANEYRLALLGQMTQYQSLVYNPWAAPIWPVPTP